MLLWHGGQTAAPRLARWVERDGGLLLRHHQNDRFWLEHERHCREWGAAGHHGRRRHRRRTGLARLAPVRPPVIGITIQPSTLAG